MCSLNLWIITGGDYLVMFFQVEFKTASGQMLDLITTHEGEKDLTKYNIGV